MKASNKGQTLVEIVLVIGAAGLVLFGLTRATTVALRNAQFAKNHTLATQYAQEGMEKARQLRDAGWEEFWGKKEKKCGLDKGGDWFCNGFCPYEPNIDNLFIRCLEFEDVSGGDNDKMKVISTVLWNDHQIELVSFLTKWE